MSSSVGDRIKELRSHLKLTQVQFAKKIGVKGGVVSAWEKGAAGLPHGRLLIICNEYGVNADWILKGKGKMFEPPSAQSGSPREAALEYARSFLKKLPENSQNEFVEFFRELVRLFDADAADDAKRPGRKSSSSKSSEKPSEPETIEDDQPLQLPSADDDFDDEEEFDLEADYNE